MEVRVPDIGDFKDVPVIEVLVKPGDRIAKNDSLIALESEKATMEVPSPEEGTVEAINVNVGDKVSQGSVILTLAATNSHPEVSRSAQEGASVGDDRTSSGDDKDPEVSRGETRSTPPSLPQGGSMPHHDEDRVVQLTVPDIGDFKDVPVIEVLVKAGDRIEKDASLITLESEKATMEVPASAAGTVRDVNVRPGDKVSQGTVIATVSPDVPAPSVPQPFDSGIRKANASAQPFDSGVRNANASAQPFDSGVRNANASAQDGTRGGNGVVHASPSIRRFARELGVDLHRVTPSGPNGRVTRDDVQHFVKRALGDGGGSVASGGTLAIAPWPAIDFAKFGEIERKPLSRIKRISGANLQRNWVTIPHVTQNDDADVTDLEAFRNELNAELGKGGVKITMLAFLIKACIAALKKYPEFNSSLDGEELVFKRYYNIGFAADTPNGLVVPVIRGADGKGIAQLASETAALAAKARDGKLSPSEMQGGTFTISSLGSIGGTYFTPIINAPEVAILGACRASMRPVWNGTAFEPRLMQPLSLSYDHRVIDGAAAARFVTFLRTVLSDLRRALL